MQYKEEETTGREEREEMENIKQPIRAQDTGVRGNNIKRKKPGSGIQHQQTWQRAWRRCHEKFRGLHGLKKPNKVCSNFGRSTEASFMFQVCSTATESRKRRCVFGFSSSSQLFRCSDSFSFIWSNMQIWSKGDKFAGLKKKWSKSPHEKPRYPDFYSLIRINQLKRCFTH